MTTCCNCGGQKGLWRVECEDLGNEITYACSHHLVGVLNQLKAEGHSIFEVSVF